MPKLSIGKLNDLYRHAENIDNAQFAEERTNILLYSGKHFSKKTRENWERTRTSKSIAEESKLRITKNHIQRICDTYINNIANQAPGVAIMPKNESELQDQKAAEMFSAVWEDIKERYNFSEKIYYWIYDFVVLGEAFCKIGFDEQGGDFLGYEEVIEEDQLVSRPVFSGAFTYERVFGFDLLRDPDAKSFDESRYVIYRKMVPRKTLEEIVGDKEEITSSTNDTYKIFDGVTGTYTETKDSVMVKEYFFKPSPKYPKGYFYITTEAGILFEGELPLGIFPISRAFYQEAPTCPRGKSIIKQLRPIQVEINRASSKIGETQITLGDDKVIVQNGSKIGHGGYKAGVRFLTVSGMAPTILPGRSGEQYMGYLNSQIEELYRIANLPDALVEKAPTDPQPYALLYRSMKDKQKFSIYAQKIERFLTDICEKSLRYAQAFYKPEMIIRATGRDEIINIPEFKKTDNLGFVIKIEDQSEDIESRLGKQLSLTQTLQYVGKQLQPDQIGRVLRNMPFCNAEEITSDLTLNYDNVRNDILSLDRGEYRPANRYDDHEYYIKTLYNRVKKPDFAYLEEQIQQMYQAKIQEHEQYAAKIQQEVQAAKDGYIPSGGYMVKCDFYIQTDPNSPEKTKRATLPSEAVQWLINRLSAQGSAQNQLEQIQPVAQADIGQMLVQQQPQLVQ